MTALPTTLAVAQFRSLEATRPLCGSWSWATLAARLGVHLRRRQKDGPGWSPTQYRPDTTRSKENVITVSALVLDCDEGVPDWGRLNAYAYAAHTTFSHTPEAPRWRVALPLAAPVSAEEWPGLWARGRAALCPNMDAACKDASRFYWWPACRPEVEPQIARHDGAWLDLSHLPPGDEPASVHPVHPDRTGVRSANDGQRPGDAFAASASWASILEPHGWRLVYARGEEGHWRRPGKRDGTSATTNYAGTELLYVFSSNASPFEPGATYTKFGAFAQLETGGDFESATKLLAGRGYGAPAATVPVHAPARAPRPLTNFLVLDW